MRSRAAPFQLVPRRRLLGDSFGGLRSARRGRGVDVAGSRAYQPGDDMRAIDWRASARLSSARGGDEFVVRESYVEEAPRVVLVLDRRPTMALYPPLPWLDKPAAVAVALELITASAHASRGVVGRLELGDGQPDWRPPHAEHDFDLPATEPRFVVADDVLERSLDYLAGHRTALPTGTFVFVLSDFLAPPPERGWVDALERRWDVVPVVVQDPVWEQTFPDVAGVVIPFVDPRSGEVVHTRLTRREVAALRADNEQRRAELLRLFETLDLQPVLVSSSERQEIESAFLAWSTWREVLRSAHR